MARLGVFCFPGTGHINPMTALARRLQQRGHEVVFFGIADTEARVKAAGVEFCLIGTKDYPPGTLDRLDKELAKLKGLRAFTFTVERIKNTALMVLRDGPEAARRANIDALLVDEADFAGTVADHLSLPFVSVALIPPLVDSARIPPFFFGWKCGVDPLSRLRNQLGIWLLTYIAAPIFAAVNDQREAWGLPRFRRTAEALSPVVQVTQLPAALEFENAVRPHGLHYAGPFVDARYRPPVDFPWDQLDNRPLIYASFGTLQNRAQEIFRAIAEACTGLEAQLVISLGGGLEPESLGSLPGDPLVVKYAPQLELVKRASAVITHAGINTALESLAEGVPLVCIPLGNDQPGVAARVVARGAGVLVPWRKLTPARLRAGVLALLHDRRYRNAAREIQTAIGRIDGLGLASDIIEEKLNIQMLAQDRQRAE